MKKSPISRANIVHFETLTLYQNVSYKMAMSKRNNTIFVSFEKMVQMIAKWNKVYQAPSLSFIETNKFSSSIFVIAKTFFPI